MNGIKKKFFIALLLLISLPLSKAFGVQTSSPLGRLGGDSPSLGGDSVFCRPFTFWYWMYGAVSKPGIHADLCGMKDIGLGGCYLMPIRSSKDKPEFKGTADQLTPEFWNMVDYAFQQADSLSLQMGIHVCDGFALAGFPTITPAESMQKVVWSDTIVSQVALSKFLKSGKKLSAFPVRQPESYNGYYEDITTIAIPCKEIPHKWKPAKVVLSDNISTNKGYWLASTPATITYSFAKPVTVRSMYIEPEGNNVQSERLLVEASNDGKTYRKVRQLVPPRQGWQNTGYGYTYFLPSTTARFFRFSWTPDGTEPGSEDLDAAKWKALLKLRNITLSNEERIDNYEGKAAYVWRIDADSSSCQSSLSETRQVQNISSHFSTGGGKVVGFRILRIGHTSTGQMNATAGGGKGLEVDKFSSSTTQKLLNGWFLKFLSRPHSSVVKYLHVDSWECGSQNWGENFAQEFKQRRGYDLLPYMQVMCGYPLESARKTEQVLRDVRLTINELVNDKFFATVQKVGHDHGMLISHESIAPTFPADGIEHYKSSDLPMGEFWLNSPTHDKPNDMLDAVSGAHIYGKNIVQAEGFTEVRGTWDETPMMIKPLLDRNFCLGMNRLFFHVNAHNPWMDRRPGMTLDGIGLFFQRDNTWYREARGLVEYATHCQTELQKGSPIADIAVFTGEGIPSRALTPDKLVPLLPGLFGQERVESEKKRLANVGQPMVESPVGVTHSANIFSLDGWTNPLHGYHYDCVNPDFLLSGKDFKYRVLVVPQKVVSDKVRRRIDELKAQGVVIIDSVYTKPDLSEYGIEPEVILPEGIDYTARKIDDNTIMYFLSNPKSEGRTFSASFRDAAQSFGIVSQMNTAGHFENTFPVLTSTKGNRRSISLTLPPYGSAFVYLTTGLDIKLDPLWRNVERVPLDGEWTRKFEHSDSSEVVTLPDDWVTSDNPKVLYYSGHATYSTTFRWKGKSAERGFLQLGRAHDIAHVYVNGKDCGIAWTYPFDVIIPSEVLKKGENKLDIVIVNTWNNALLGAENGQPPFPGIWTNAKYRPKKREPMQAGLTGPIRLEMQKCSIPK